MLLFYFKQNYFEANLAYHANHREVCVLVCLLCRYKFWKCTFI